MADGRHCPTGCAMAYEGELRCDSCHRPYLGQVDWTFTMKGGQVVEVVCSECGGQDGAGKGR